MTPAVFAETTQEERPIYRIAYEPTDPQGEAETELVMPTSPRARSVPPATGPEPFTSLG